MGLWWALAGHGQQRYVFLVPEALQFC
ncbi:MAG: hypothetical protein RIR45_804, partial [Pseudomonadota bacterium]